MDSLEVLEEGKCHCSCYSPCFYFFLKTCFFFIEAALLIECGYLNIVDEMWYIYAREDIRRKRLKESRNYTDEKINAIMDSQLKEEEFRKYCKVVIDNSGSLEDSYEQIDRELGEAH